MQTSLEHELDAVTTRGAQQVSDTTFIEAAYRAYVRGGRSASNFRQLETVAPGHDTGPGNGPRHSTKPSHTTACCIARR